MYGCALYSLQCFPNVPVAEPFCYGVWMETTTPGRHLVGYVAMDKVECSTALKRRSCDGPSNRSAQAGSLPVCAYLRAFRNCSASLCLPLGFGE